MDLDRAIEYAIDGDALLFVGAGFSSGATNLRGQSFKTGSQLAAYFSQATGLPEATPLDDAAEEFINTKGTERLINELSYELKAKDICDYHATLTSIPWRRIYTTNYDNIIETALAHNSLKFTPVMPGDSIHKVPKDNVLCVHLNGYIDRLTQDSLFSEFKLTDTRYPSGSLFDSPLLVLFHQDLQAAKSVFFVGYSLADLDIKRLLSETAALKEKTFILLGSTPDPITSRRVGRYGNILTEDTQKLAGFIETKLSTYVPSESPDDVGHSIHEIETPSSIFPGTDRYLFDLLLQGNLEKSNIRAGLHDGSNCFLERFISDRILGQIDHHNVMVVVHSELGNGPSLIFEGIAYLTLTSGYNVFKVKTRTEELFRELDIVFKKDEKCLLVIDNYQEWLDVIEYFGMHAGPDTSLLLSASSAVNDILIDRIAGMVGRDNICEIPVDRLFDQDANQLIEFFNKYGL